MEPEFYLPIIPMALVNGSEGIGTGWSSSIPCFNPRDLVDQIKKKINGEDFDNLVPWFRGYKGVLTPNAKNGYNVEGVYEEIEDDEGNDVIEISELPIRTWTKNYNDFLEEYIQNNNDEIQDIMKNHTPKYVNFHLYLSPEALVAWKKEGISKKLKLSSSISINNMVMFDKNRKLKKYVGTNYILIFIIM